MDRGSGILMHVSSLPGGFGIGTFGQEAYSFIDFIKKSGFKYWQVLPMGHTTYGDSPYQCFSAFAGNPYFIDFEMLEKDGLLNEIDYKDEFYGISPNLVEYGTIFITKYKVLKKAYNNFINSGNKGIRAEFQKFKVDNSFWLEDYSLYMSLKYYFNMKSWFNWDEDIKKREPTVIIKYRNKLKDDIEYWTFIQYLFFKQWKDLKSYANEEGIKIIGDIPIYVAEDSVDTWSDSKLFKIDKISGKPIAVAGCPPDYFSKSGQLWGNIVYDWDEMKKDNYKWWVSRIKENLNLYDILRIDHFRGFESYWEIPYGEESAINGKWVKGPGIALFNKLEEELGEVNIIAEDLGYLTEEVRNFLKETKFPGMKVLEFAFDGNWSNSYLPHMYGEKCIAYTGTHDNDTFKGWYEKIANRNEVMNAKKYLGLNEEEGSNWGFIRGVWSSVAEISIAPIQDFLNLGNEARFNLPSTLGENWVWRLDKNSINKELAKKVYEFNQIYGRI